jgi:seryl-tRNA synthetase
MKYARSRTAPTEVVMITFPRRLLLWVAVVVLCFAAFVFAQGKTESTDGSLATLTAEVRQLRMAVEESTRSQTQTQALGVYLSVQQSRITQVATRLDSARKELDTATNRLREITSTLDNMQTELLQTSETQRRAALEDGLRQLKVEQQRVAIEEQQARSREADLAHALQLEDSRWTDLITKLEQLIKK